MMPLVEDIISTVQVRTDSRIRIHRHRADAMAHASMQELSPRTRIVFNTT